MCYQFLKVCFIQITIFFEGPSLALRLWYTYLSASEVNLNDIGK